MDTSDKLMAIALAVACVVASAGLGVMLAIIKGML